MAALMAALWMLTGASSAQTAGTNGASPPTTTSDDGTQCDAATFLHGVAPVSAGGVASLKTKWFSAYTRPMKLVPNPEDKKWKDTGENLTAASIAFGTNTFADLKNPTRQQLVFRDSAIYNLAVSLVGLRAAKLTVPNRADALSNEVFTTAAAAAKVALAKDGKNATAAAAEAKKAAEDLQKKYADAFVKVRDAANAAVKSGGNDVSKLPAAELQKVEDARLAAEWTDKASKLVATTAEHLASTHPDAPGQVAAALDEKAAALVQNGADLDCKEPIINHRLFQTDRYYFSRDLSKKNAKGFFSNGLVARSVATSTDGEAKSGLFTAYIGFGIDGPLYTLFNGKSQGFASTELFVAYNRMTRSGVTNLFSKDDLPRQFGTYGLNFEVAIQEQVSVKISYGRGFGRLGKEVGDLVMSSIVMQR